MALKLNSHPIECFFYEVMVKLNTHEMKFKVLLLLSSACLVFSSCSKKLREAEARYATLNTSYMDLQKRYSACQDSSSRYLDRIKALNDQLGNQQTSNTQLLQQLKDLSVISGSQAESIKKSLENIGYHLYFL